MSEVDENDPRLFQRPTTVREDQRFDGRRTRTLEFGEAGLSALGAPEDIGTKSPAAPAEGELD